MRIQRTTALAAFSLALSPCFADTLTSLATHPAPESRAQSPATQPESEDRIGWALNAKASGSLLPQAQAIFAVLRKESGIHGDSPVEPTVLNVAASDDRPGEGIRDGNGSQGCLRMPRPGSRIMETRCYYPSEGEQALNTYQFRQEIRFAIEQQRQFELQRAEAEAAALRNEALRNQLYREMGAR
jgi:hypothetical protein